LHPLIADAAVVPSPDEDAGEVAKAFSVLRSPLTVEKVLTFMATRVSPRKKIRRVEFVEQLGKGSWCWHARQKSVLETKPAARSTCYRLFTDEEHVEAPKLPAEAIRRRTVNSKQDRELRALAKLLARMSDERRGLLFHMASKMANRA
jgi:acyl-CoA synthetase (AMP-forming)/AMP-acid ligase II